ncbi:protein aurora borealis isoform X2 [Petromyzon marinus]|uniref:protein aurora borealis isoform X2 n=1 Tax=Petromyzon marinus TaxID=7757 RepID=UPI003F6EE42C
MREVTRQLRVFVTKRGLINGMESPQSTRDVCGSAGTGACEDLHETVVNPFEFPGFLAHHALSPNTCTFKISTPSTNSAKKTPSRFRWSIDEMANLQPAAIHPEEIHRQALYLSTVSLDQELEEKTQLEIEQFFSRGTIVPSPWTQSDNKQPARKQYANSPMDPLTESPTAKPSTNLGKTCDVACQTSIALPVGFDLEALLADFRRREDSLCSDGSGLSLRRKLFVDNLEENSCDSSAQSVYTPPHSQTNRSSASPSATQQRKDHSSEQGTTHSTEQFSSSPIQASDASSCVCTPDSQDVRGARNKDASSLPSPIHIHEEMAAAVSLFEEEWTHHLSPSPTNSRLDKLQWNAPTSQIVTKYPSLRKPEWTSPEPAQQTQQWDSPSSPCSQSPPLATAACPQMLEIISPIASVKLQKLSSEHVTDDAGDNGADGLKDLSFSKINVHKSNGDTFSSQKYTCAEFSQGNRTGNVQETEFSIEAQLTGELKLPEIMSSTYNTGTELLDVASNASEARFENKLELKKDVKSCPPTETDDLGCNGGRCNDVRAPLLWDLSTRKRLCDDDDDGFGVPMEVTRGDDWPPPRNAARALVLLQPQAESSCLPNEVDSGYSTYHMTEEEIKVKDVSNMEVDLCCMCATADGKSNPCH